MSFNRVSFNQVAFNIELGMVKYIFGRGRETVNAVCGSALDFRSIAIAFENVRKESIIGASGIFISAAAEENIQEIVVEALMTAVIYPHGTEEVAGNVIHAAEYWAVCSGSEKVTEKVGRGGVNLRIKAAGSVRVAKGTFSMRPKIYRFGEGYELVTQSATLENVSIRKCRLTLTLAARQTLIIDANNYDVTLIRGNGTTRENAIDKQSGDWIDELNRNTKEIVISAASGVQYLAADVIYTERYL